MSCIGGPQGDRAGNCSGPTGHETPCGRGQWGRPTPARIRHRLTKWSGGTGATRGLRSGLRTSSAHATDVGLPPEWTTHPDGSAGNCEPPGQPRGEPEAGVGEGGAREGRRTHRKVRGAKIINWTDTYLCVRACAPYRGTCDHGGVTQAVIAVARHRATVTLERLVFFFFLLTSRRVVV